MLHKTANFAGESRELTFNNGADITPEWRY